MNRVGIVFSLIAILFFGTFSSAAMAAVNQHANENSDRVSVFIPDRYIVVLEDDFAPQDVAKGHGISPMFVYKKALNGFAATIPPPLLEKLQKDSRVKYVEQDKIAEITSQVLPNGMDRINLETNAIVTIDGQDDGLGLALIAIIDTGVDRQHPDLKVHPTLGIECSAFFNMALCNEGGAYGDDDNGHGTHVAGVAAALDNGIGVVGVAPGATIVPVKVLDANGGGSVATVLAGIDYVTLKAGEIDVANMSLRVLAVSPSINDAVAASVDAGVVYVVAAGNDVLDASTVSPASEAKAITVSALADFDGKAGGLNHQIRTYMNYTDPENPTILCNENTDDSFACFSNFGDIVDIIAPGVDILSTVPIGTNATCMFCTPDGLRLASGTSSAAPHVAGAAALIRSQDFSMSPAAVEAALLSMATPKNSADGYTIDSNDYHFPDDPPPSPSVEFEPLLMMGETPPPNPIPVADAGPNQNVNEQVPVSLDGSNSNDPEGGPITYSWSQTSGPSVLLDDPTLDSPSFTSPTVFAPTDLVFSLVVNDGLSDSLADDVTISVANNLNELPIADAGTDQNVNEQVPVSLDGSNSNDPEGETITYSWSQTSGPAVLLDDPNIVSPSFTSSIVFAPTNLIFSLVVNDGLSNSIADSVTVTVANNINELPTADAGIDQTVNDSDGDGAEMITLDGSDSSDPNNDILDWMWYEGGVLLVEGKIIGYPFSVGTHDVTLEVTDSQNAKSTDLVQITVQEISSTVTMDTPLPGDIEGKITLTSTVTNLSNPQVTYTMVHESGEIHIFDPITGAPFKESFHTKNYASGNYVITALAESGGNSAISEDLNVNIPTKGGGSGGGGTSDPKCSPGQEKRGLCSNN